MSKEIGYPTTNAWSPKRALIFCHKQQTDHFFIGDLAETVNDLLEGRHDDRVLTDKKVGLLLRALGIHGQRVVKGYKVSLTDGVREQIHRVAEAYQVVALQDGVAAVRSLQNRRGSRSGQTKQCTYARMYVGIMNPMSE